MVSATSNTSESNTNIYYRIDDLGLPAVHPRMAFITGALDKEIRLSFAQRIRGTLPDPYQDLITEGKEKDTPDFKYSSDGKLGDTCLLFI